MPEPRVTAEAWNNLWTDGCSWINEQSWGFVVSTGNSCQLTGMWYVTSSWLKSMALCLLTHSTIWNQAICALRTYRVRAAVQHFMPLRLLIIQYHMSFNAPCWACTAMRRFETSSAELMVHDDTTTQRVLNMSGWWPPRYHMQLPIHQSFC